MSTRSALLRTTLTLALTAAAATSHAAVFVVNNTADAGPGSLRAAIANANATPGADTIRFAIPGIGPFVISPLTPLPAITDTVLLDASTQVGSACFAPGAPAALQVALNGAFAGATAGISFAAGSSGSLLRGLVIQNFNGDGVLITAPNVALECNLVGTTVAGTGPLANAGNGVHTTATNTRIGGAVDAQRNVISGNTLAGVLVDPATPGAQANLIRNNFIGLGATGGVINNGAAGVRVLAQPGTEIARNFVSANVAFGPLGIDIAAAGVTLNDAGDADAAPMANSGQNFPVITAVGGGVIQATLDGPVGTYRIEYFTTPYAGRLGHTHLGSIVIVKPAGLAAFASPAYPLVPGTFVTATATLVAAPSETSEFSASFLVP